MFCNLLFFLAVYCGKVELVHVKVEQGLLKGQIVQSATGNGTYASFKGIPYAAPPVGELRFKAPQPPLAWKGERSAIEHGSVCPQKALITDKYTPGNEDCLFLNVYTPTLKPESPLPVMFYIHGGGLIAGSGNDDEFGPDFLIDKDVIVVTTNYRLGALGFISLDIDEAPGNAGLKDQVAAMQWVKKNIANFGGNPNNVTIFGQSSGGASVSLQVLSPMSKGLFQRAIAMSGTFLNDFSISFEHKRRALLFTQQLGLYTKDPKEAFKFLQNVSVEQLVKTEPFVLYTEKIRKEASGFFPFTPVVEKDFKGQHFLMEDPEKLLREGKTNVADIMIGHTSQESAYEVAVLTDSILKSLKMYKELLVPAKITNIRDPRLVLAVADRIQTHYYGNKEINNDTIKETIAFISDYGYNVDIHRYLEMWTKAGKKAYYYQFSFYGERTIYGKYAEKYGVKAAAHADDLLYLFTGTDYPKIPSKDSVTYKMILETCTLYTNFAKYGNPTPDKKSVGIIWKEYNNKQSYLDINSPLSLKTFDGSPNINFWRRIFDSVGILYS